MEILSDRHCKVQKVYLTYNHPQSGYTLKWKVNAANWTKLLFSFCRTEEEEYDAEEETGLLEKTTSYRLFPF